MIKEDDEKKNPLGEREMRLWLNVQLERDERYPFFIIYDMGTIVKQTSFVTAIWEFYCPE